MKRFDTPLHQDLVLVGGGHAHALALRMLAMRPVEGLRITLVSPDSHTPYSGMLPGLVAGHYDFDQTHIDLARLCQWAGVRFITGEVSALDPLKRQLSLIGRAPLTYDLVSLDIGSQPELDSVPGAREHAVPVKPVASLWQRWQALYQRIIGQRIEKMVRIAVVGGGAGSVELVLAMAHRLAGRDVCFDLYCGAEVILQGYNRRAREAVETELMRQGVAVHTGARVERVNAQSLQLENGNTPDYDELFWCTGAAAAPWVAASGLPTDERGFMLLQDTLQSVGNDTVFGAGDVGTQRNHPRPKAGVYAVRQGPVLAHNLHAALLHKPLRKHRPQQSFLSLLSLGERVATADKGPLSATGRWVWRCKDRIDTQFMQRFSELPSAMPSRHWGRLPELAAAHDAQPPCGGCGAKVGSDALRTALADLHDAYPQHCSVNGDDAEQIPTAAGAPILQSLDLLREIVTDPYVMGRIAANHAMSDLYACAARPVSAQAAVIMPFATADLQQRDLQQLLAGALHEFSQVDCQLLGGHSMQGQELALGFVVNGVPMDASQTVLAKQGAAVGDQLLLTKALGTGTLFAAHMQLAAHGRDIAAALQSMLLSNRTAAELAVSHGVNAATDVTGFGLAGHLLEMLGPGQGARLELDAIPLLPGAHRSLSAGIFSTAHTDNAQASAAPDVIMGSPAGQALFDPQTSGGLLLAVDPRHANALCAALRDAGYADTAIVGEVIALAPAENSRLITA
tara:strand:+ start:299902 stop:302115 length:2214 start_codon:yes stop_codon:yes gene_type:complete